MICGAPARKERHEVECDGIGGDGGLGEVLTDFAAPDVGVGFDAE